MILIGILFILFGFSIVVIKPAWYDSYRHFYFDFSGYKRLFGVFLFIYGFFLLRAGIKRKSENKKK